VTLLLPYRVLNLCTNKNYDVRCLHYIYRSETVGYWDEIRVLTVSKDIDTPVRPHLKPVHVNSRTATAPQPLPPQPTARRGSLRSPAVLVPRAVSTQPRSSPLARLRQRAPAGALTSIRPTDRAASRARVASRGRAGARCGRGGRVVAVTVPSAARGASVSDAGSRAELCEAQFTEPSEASVRPFSPAFSENGAGAKRSHEATKRWAVSDDSLGSTPWVWELFYDTLVVSLSAASSTVVLERTETVVVGYAGNTWGFLWLVVVVRVWSSETSRLARTSW